MDKPSNGINPKPPGTQNGKAPKNKGKASATLPTGNSLPKGKSSKVPGAKGSVQ